ncbi:uncharacterized protein EKO05_0002864 [Ascochyta rabiei]|uniref:uncharacterized protein n=1 Tax=Didymella rabiei TaxID=5454 RepID=UPI0021F94266|nr:uncharacterized protein EKO05_0002864 [Ascochyta rabiei]UPX12310.1 hypothetical protein EKO05_0002864 [Ascochyta rabiei]
MATPSPSHQSSRSSTGAPSQQSTLVTNAASTQPSSSTIAWSPSSTPNSTLGPAAASETAFERAARKQHSSSSSNVSLSVPSGTVPPAGSASFLGVGISSGPNVSSSSTKPSNSKVLNALRKFKARLSGPELTAFRGTTVNDLHRDMRRLQAEQEKRRDMVNMRRIQGCIEAMDQFGKVIEVFLNVSEAVAFVWGPMKFLLLTASAFVEHFETLLEAYEKIGDHMPLLRQYEKLFSHDDQLKGALELMYVDILDFHESAVHFFRGKAWNRFFRSMWKNFDTKFGGILKNLGRHKDFVENCAQLAQYELYQSNLVDMRTASSNRFQQYQQNVVEMNIKLDELVAEQQLEKMKALVEWLAVGQQAQEDHDEYQKIRSRYKSTVHWILSNEHIKHWAEANIPAKPVMWMNGIPGAGKTILASAIIDRCKSMVNYATAFYYCHDIDQTSSSAVGILKGIIAQLLSQDPQLFPPCHSRYKSSGEPVLRSLSQATRLLDDICTILPKTFIIIDGLDECEQCERKQVMNVLMEMVTQCEKAEPGKLRLLVVSQNYADIKRGLCNPSQSRPVAHILQLSETDIESDINMYVKIEVGRIATKFSPFNEDMIQYLQYLTVHNAKGMFLYAKLVLENLFAQPTREDLLKGIQRDTFPIGLKGAYERILRCMKQVSAPEEWEKAKKLLGWIICAKRRLTWKEIQVALSIDVDNETIEYNDRRLRRHIHEICGSLVLLNGDRVSLVHSTAKTYVTTVMKDVHSPSIECELATLCLRYLTFPCFDVSAISDQQELKELALEGHLTFQDYAVAKWFHHVNAFVSSGPKFMQESPSRDTYLDNMNTALEDFMLRYGDANWGQNIVEDCRTNCSAFQGLPVHDRLMELTSHIFTFQQRGFDARHDVSIKSLAAALERNRKLLEELPSSKMFDNDDLVRYCQFYDHERVFKCTKITCRYFSEGFKDAKARKKHVNIHERPFHCEVPDCLGGEGFLNAGDLQRHLRAFHPEMSDLAETFNSVTKPRAKTDHACAICGKTFTRSFARRNHENSHRGVRPHECPECGKAFTRANDLVRHQKLHERA